MCLTGIQCLYFILYSIYTNSMFIVFWPVRNYFKKWLALRTQHNCRAILLFQLFYNPPPLSPGLLIRSQTRGQYVAPRCRINAMVFSFYPRAIRIWNIIPPKITNLKNPKSFQEAIMVMHGHGTPFHHT